MPTWTKALGAALLVLTLTSACSSSSDSTSRDDEGNLTESGDVNVFDLEVGDCFNQPPDGTITEVAGVPCEQAHDNEVYATFDIEGGSDAPFPGDAAIQTESEKCSADLFTEYVGTPFDDSRFTATSFNPTQDGWEQSGDREVICFALTKDRTQITGSVKDTAE